MKITVHARTSLVGSRVETEVEIPDEDLEGLTEAEQAKQIEDWARDAMWELIEWGWERKER